MLYPLPSAFQTTTLNSPLFAPPQKKGRHMPELPIQSRRFNGEQKERLRSFSPAKKRRPLLCRMRVVLKCIIVRGRAQRPRRGYYQRKSPRERRFMSEKIGTSIAFKGPPNMKPGCPRRRVYVLHLLPFSLLLQSRKDTSLFWCAASFGYLLTHIVRLG